MHPLSNQIAGSLDWQSLWKESFDILKFFHGDFHQGKVAYKTNTFGWVRPGMSLVLANCRIYESTLFLEGID